MLLGLKTISISSFWGRQQMIESQHTHALEATYYTLFLDAYNCNIPQWD